MRVKLTDAGVERLGPGRWHDTKAPGLVVRVTPAGVGSYYVLYRHGRRLRWYRLDAVAAVTLGKARRAARDIRARAALGQDPARQDRARARAALTVADLVAAYRASADFARLQPATVRSYDWTLSALVKALGPTPVAGLEAQRLRALFERRAPSTAGRLYELLRVVTRWARRRGLVEADPMAGVERPGPRPRRDRVLTEDDLRRLLREVTRRPSRTRLGLKLILLTTARPGEVFGATFAEFAEERGGASPGWWWTLPADRSKTGEVVRRPLSPQAVAIVDQLRLLGGDTLFEPPRGRSPIAMRERWAVALQKLRTKAGVAGVRAHDLRRTAATMLARLGVRFEVIETLLGHALPGVSGVYIRHSYDAEMRAALELLGEEVDRL